MRTAHLIAVLPLLAVGCDAKKESTPAPAVTASAKPPLPVAASTSPTASAAAYAPGKKLTLRQLVWAEKTPADTKFVDCVVAACLPTLKECYGDRVEQGEPGGPCSEFAACESRCADGAGRAACSAACVEKHRSSGGACDACGDKIGECSDKAKCQAPIALPH